MSGQEKTGLRATYEKVINGATWKFELQAETLQEFLKTASFLSQIPSLCGKCGETDIAFHYKFAENQYDYFQMKCLNPRCEHELQFGEFKKGGMYVKPGWNPKYGKQGEESPCPAMEEVPRGFVQPNPENQSENPDYTDKPASDGQIKKLFTLAGIAGMDKETTYKWIQGIYKHRVWDTEAKRVSAKKLTHSMVQSLFTNLETMAQTRGAQ